MDLVMWVLKDMEPGRMVEGFVYLMLLFWKVKPHLTRVEQQMAGVVDELKKINVRLEHGEERFDKIESRLSKLEPQPKE